MCLCAIVDCWCVDLLFAVVYVAWFWCLLCAELLLRFGVVGDACCCFEFLGDLRVGGLGSVVISGFLSIAVLRIGIIWLLVSCGVFGGVGFWVGGGGFCCFVPG